LALPRWAALLTGLLPTVLLLTALLPAVPLPAALTQATRWAGHSAWAAGMKLEDYEAGAYPLGGEFTLSNQHGRRASLKDFRGRVVLVFFGYTYCPDVCPLTLTEMGRLRGLLGADFQRVQPVFITVDPARDTPPRLKSYLANFDPSIVGLTGPEKEIRAVASRYQARFARSDAKTSSGYLIDHTGFVYMLDGEGKVRYLFTFDVGADLLAQGVRRLLKN
jgi:protein SCO1/2